jgi:phosphoglycerol transferase MdoB-like AlkP superfamily enzyme
MVRTLILNAPNSLAFLGYYQHANAYWNKGVGIQAVGEIDLCLNKFVDLSIEDSSYRRGELDPKAPNATCDDGELGNDECYEEHLFTQNTLKILDEHDPMSPLFLFHSFHLIHTPLEVPKAYIRKAEERLAAGGFHFDDSGRQNYSAMVTYMDDAVGQIVGKLKTKGMWKNSVVAFMSDNGGPIYKPGGGDNHPLRAGKQIQ